MAAEQQNLEQLLQTRHYQELNQGTNIVRKIITACKYRGREDERERKKKREEKRKTLKKDWIGKG